MRRLPIPAPRRVLHPLRDVTTAVTSVRELPNNRRRVTIDHEPLGGVTPATLLWWFQNIAGTMPYDGGVVARYLVWHPVDHIRWELAKPAPGGGAQEGARFRIVEAFGARPEYYVDSTERVEKLDESGIRLVRRFLGVKVFELSHTWSRCDGHTHYLSVMEISAVARGSTSSTGTSPDTGSPPTWPTPGSCTTSRRSGSSSTSFPPCSGTQGQPGDLVDQARTSETP